MSSPATTHLNPLSLGAHPVSIEGQNKASTFRPDLEGLRGIAVLIVLLFHLGISSVAGGFIGVDVFFVLSGYFMARTLSKTDYGSVMEFFGRRIRRVLPLTLFVALAFMAIAPRLFLPHEVHALTTDFAGVIAMVPNFVYWTDVGYFATEVFHPFLHYWSLGVEYQYYLVFPLLLHLASRHRHVVLATVIVSLALCLTLTPVNAKTAFYLLPPRLWEFALGWAAFQLADQRASPILKASFARTLQVLAALTIAICAVSYDSTLPYPGHWAMLPAMASFVLIVAGAHCPPPSLGIIGSTLRYLGQISFSIYLLHYPIIFIAKYSPFYHWKKLDWMTQSTLLLATLGASILTYHLIERPLRNAKLVSNRLFYSICGLMFASSLALIGLNFHTDFYLARHDIVIQGITQSVQERPSFRCGRLATLDLAHDSCALVSGVDGGRRVLAIGNSHIDSLKPVLISLANQSQSSLFLTKSNCTIGAGKHCDVDSAIAILKRRQITDVVFQSYVDESFDYLALRKFVQAAERLGVRTHLVDPVPIYKKSVPERLYVSHTYSDDSSHESIDLVRYERQYKDYLTNTAAIAAQFDSVKLHRTRAILCTPICQTHRDNKVFYFDSNHLTESGAKQLVPLLRPAFGFE